jgi:hypothetical protein
MLSFLFKTLKTVLTCKNNRSILLLRRDSPNYRGERNVVHKNSLDKVRIRNLVARGTADGLWVSIYLYCQHHTGSRHWEQ